MKKLNFYVVRVLYKFTRLRGARLITYCRNITTLMVGLAPYTSPSPTLATVNTEIDSYESLVEKAMNGDRIAIAARDAQLVVLLNVMRDLGAYVQGNCQNSRALLTATGFEASAPRNNSSVIPNVPSNNRLENAKVTGSLKYRFKRSKNAMNYSIQLADDAEGPWTDWGLTTRANNELSGLTPLKTKWARARANGAAGSSDWSEPTCKIVM